MSLSPKRPVVVLIGLFASVAVLWAGPGCDTALRDFVGGTGANAPAGQSLNDAASPTAAADAEVVRDIEEADVVKIVGDKIYALNYRKGLIIVNVSNPDAPMVAGTLDLRGRGIEMYVVGDRAFVVLTADFGIYPLAVGGPEATDSFAPDYSGSQVAIIDIADTAQPKLLGKINLVGYAQESRRVGDVLYVAGQTIPSWQQPGAVEPALYNPSDYFVERGFLASINIANPNDIKPVDRKTFSGAAVNIHVSMQAVFAASAQYDPNSNDGSSYTHVQIADISDAGGAIVLRDSVDVPGTIRNRFYMDEHEAVLRICTETNGFGFRMAKLFTFSLANLDDVAALGNVEIIRGESLEAVRYDGDRAYAVTFLRTDPLFVLDLSDPAHPAVAGHLEVPGFSTHIEPRGDRLIAIGIDDTAGNRPAVAYYDVSNPAAPTQLGRVILGPPNSFTDSDAVYDEKAFKIIDELGLIVVPFSHYDYAYIAFEGGAVPPSAPPIVEGGQPLPAADSTVRRPKCVDGVQLVDFSDTALTQRGWFDARARVNRVGVVGARVFALSPASLQTINVDNRDQPVLAGEAPFFDAEMMARFDQDCGGFPYYDDTPRPVDIVLTVDDLISFLQLLDGSGLCGTVTITPALAGFVGLIGLRQRYRRRR